MEISELIHKPSEKMPSTQFVGGIFPRKHISVIAAKSGVGKTWYVLKLLTDLSNGGTILNGQAYYEPKRRCFLFVGETGLELVNERQNSMHDKADDENFFIVSRIEAGRKGLILDVDRRDGVGAIYNICKSYKPDIIVFDTLMSFRSDDENAMVNSNAMMSNLQSLAESLNVAVVVTHHVRKSQGGKEKIDQDELIGSSVLVRQTACAFILSKFSRHNYRLTPVKTWWRMDNPIEYRMSENEFGQVVFDEPVPTEYTDFTERRRHVREYIDTLDEDEILTTADIASRFHMSRFTARKFLEQYCDLVSEGKDGRAALYKKKVP